VTRARLAFALLLLAAPAAAQPRDFNCVGAEALEGDHASLRFARNTDRLPERAAEALAPLAEAAREEYARNICVLGYAAADEGGAQTASRLAARRARAVAAELSRLGVERDRIRAETRTRGFTRGQSDRQAGVRVILMPAQERPPRPAMPAPGIAIRYQP
jgi:outer membrane protein OmpA-like peptidoglycan-associated protein